MAESILDYEKRPTRYSNIDGIGEMFIGFVFLALTLLMHLDNVAPSGSIWHRKEVVLIASVLILVIVYLGQKLMKERITYRRTGYVKYRSSKVKTAISTVIGFVVAGVVVVALSILWRPPQRDRYLILLAGLGFAFLYAYFLIYLTKMYYVWRYLVALCLAVGPFAVYSAFPNVHGISNLSSGGVLGSCFLASGVITFWSYLHHTKPAEMQRLIEDE